MISNKFQVLDEHQIMWRLYNKTRQAYKRIKRIFLKYDFQYFITLTFDPKIIDSNNSDVISYYLKQFFKNIKVRAKKYNLDYYIILIPDFASTEQGIHFHGLLYTTSLFYLCNSSRFGDTSIYNLNIWTYGFTTAYRLYSKGQKLLNYVFKYVTKYDTMLMPKYYYYSQYSANSGVIGACSYTGKQLLF